MGCSSCGKRYVAPAPRYVGARYSIPKKMQKRANRRGVIKKDMAPNKDQSRAFGNGHDLASPNKVVTQEQPIGVVIERPDNYQILAATGQAASLVEHGVETPAGQLREDPNSTGKLSGKTVVGDPTLLPAYDLTKGAYEKAPEGDDSPDISYNRIMSDTE